MRIAEAHTIGGEAINRRRLNDRMSGAAQRVVTLIVCEEEEDIRLRSLGMATEGAEEKREGE
jgi:hypothetical protein